MKIWNGKTEKNPGEGKNGLSVMYKRNKKEKIEKKF